MRGTRGRGILVILLLLAAPLVLPPYAATLATEVYIMAIFAVSLGLIMGYAGLVSLGHAAFFGTGAYTVAVLGQWLPNTYLLLALAVVLGGGAALASGALFIRTSGAYFLMITLAFGQVLYAVAFQWKSVTGGGDGMSVAAVLDLGFGPLGDPLARYYVMGALFLASYWLLRRFVASPAGAAVRGSMENELRMRTLGWHTEKYKLLAYTISGALAALAGALYAYYNAYVTPDLLSWILSGEVMIMVIIGGVGTLLGPAVGAAFFIVLQNYISSYTERWALLMGVIFVGFVLLGRGGLVHILRRGGRQRSGDSLQAVEPTGAATPVTPESSKSGRT